MTELAGARELLSTTWRMWGAPVIVGIAAIPFAMLLVAAMAARRRTAGVNAGWALRSALAEVFMVVGTAPWVWMILTPNPGHVRGSNLVPFRDLESQIHVGHMYAAMQIGGNLLVFAALGFCLPIRFRVGPVTSLVVGAMLSATVEALQWYLRLGRYTSVDDVMVNAAGAYLAAWLSLPWWRRRIGPARPSMMAAPTDEHDRAVTSR